MVWRAAACLPLGRAAVFFPSCFRAGIVMTRAAKQVELVLASGFKRARPLSAFWLDLPVSAAQGNASPCHALALATFHGENRGHRRPAPQYSLATGGGAHGSEALADRLPSRI